MGVPVPVGVIEIVDDGVLEGVPVPVGVLEAVPVPVGVSEEVGV